ncbi:MAG: J domain-containing protein [Bdellovibrionales bacterium]
MKKASARKTTRKSRTRTSARIHSEDIVKQTIGDASPVRTRRCDSPGCSERGDFRAPRSRKLDGYFYFCLDHVRIYNSEWDFFAGMSGDAIEDYLRDAAFWERPSWPIGANAKEKENKLREKVRRQFFTDFENAERAAEEEATEQGIPRSARLSAALHAALKAIELTPPVTFEAIKKQYRSLMKKHHPDLNGGSLEAEEKVKSIGQAYSLLKQMYGDG